MNANNPLTEQEENVIKDILKHVGANNLLTYQLAKKSKLPLTDFNNLCDSIFIKLGNGRVTIIES